MPLDPWMTLAIIVLAATLPSLIYVALLRNSEQVGRQSWGSVLYAVAYGGLISIVLVLFFQALFGDLLNRFLVRSALLTPATVGAVGAAPLVEEFFKGFGLRKTRDRVFEVEDGIIYAAAIGLGFAATENFFYQGSAFVQGGIVDWWNVVVARSLSSSLLHPVATGILGLGYGKVVVRGRSRIRLLPYYGGAVLVHAVYNYSAVTGLVITPGVPLHLPVAMVIAVVGFVLLRRAIVRWDRRSQPAA